MIRSNHGPLRWKPPDDGVDLVLAGQLARVAHDVHDARVPAAGENDEAATAHAHHEGLVVEDQRVGLPVRVAVGLVDGEALLEVRRAVDLAGDRAPSRRGGTRAAAAR